jgi:hypothetical protein
MLLRADNHTSSTDFDKLEGNSYETLAEYTAFGT